MEKKLFNELKASVREAKEIMRGRKAPSRSFTVTPINIKALRRRLNKTQAQLAKMMGISVDTLQNWEQGRVRPDSTAQSLLLLVAHIPKQVERVLSR